MSTETIERKFEVQAPAQLKVSNVRGSIDVRPGEEGVISVSAVKHKNAGSLGQTQIIIEQDDDGRVIAEAKYENSIIGLFGLNKPCRVDFTIRVPKNCSVKANCVSSEAVIEGLEGTIDINGVSGDLQLRDLRGEFNFSNVSGKLIAEKISGPLVMNTVSGKAQIVESQLPSVSAKTVSGDVSIETPLTEGPYEFKTVSGKLLLLPPENQGCVVNIKSVSGDIRTSRAITSSQGHGSNKQITILEGGPEVNVKSVSGIVRIGAKTEESMEPVVDSEPEKPVHHAKSQMQILEEIERGELSVDEALKQMNP
ncbi:MAG: DUF4097 family beta strand repeat-containing protein [Anaerolineales bacterium]